MHNEQLPEAMSNTEGEMLYRAIGVVLIGLLAAASLAFCHEPEQTGPSNNTPNTQLGTNGPRSNP